MTVGGDIKPSLNELAHHGVKGMKWGKQKDEPDNPKYTKQMRAHDLSQHGARAVGRINQHLNAGGTRAQALEREDVRNARQRLAVAGAVILTGLLADHGNVAAGSLKTYVGNRANDNRAAAKSAAVGIGSSAAKTPFVKPRRGVFDITTMK
jgi:hypothetical protein